MIKRNRFVKYTWMPLGLAGALLANSVCFASNAFAKDDEPLNCAPEDIDCRVVAAKSELERDATANKKALRKDRKQTDELRGRGSFGKGSARSSGGKGSIYDGFNNVLFVRGGALLYGHVTNGEIDTLGFTGGMGYRRRLSTNGRSSWWFQPEFVYFRDRGVDDPTLEFPTETVFTGRAGLLSVRWAYDGGYILPFVSVGAGPASLNTRIDDNVTISDTSFIGVGYTGSVGFETKLAEALYFETAYRFLGIVRDEAFGFHSAEIGLNYRF